MITSFPFLFISKKYNIPYGDILVAANIYYKGSIPYFITPGSILERDMLTVCCQHRDIQLGRRPMEDRYMVP